MARGERDESWLEDFSYILDRDAMRIERGGDKYDVFTGSKPLAWLWLAAVATTGGALGGTLVSGALWDRWVQVPLWLAVTIALTVVIRRLTLSMSGTALGSLAGWCIGWGMIIGAVAMWGAQLSSAGWAYGIAGGVGFFFVGITQGVYEPDDLENHDIWFMASSVLAPVAACAAAWVHRNLLAPPTTIESSAMAGALGGLIFLAPVMALLLAQLNNIAGLKRLAALVLHRDEMVSQAVGVLNTAIRLAPDDAALLDRRALAFALAGNEEKAEADWARHEEMAPKSGAAEISRGWVHLRRGRLADSAASFETALARSKRDPRALIGLGIARLRAGDAAGAVEALSKVPMAKHHALSLTHLAEARLAAGDAKAALRDAEVAIDELDSFFARSWLVRGEAKRALGRTKGAAKDYNKAWHLADEEGIQDRALAGLDAIEMPLDEDPPD